MKWSIIENPGFVSASHDPIELDAVVTGLTGLNPVDVGYLRLVLETIKNWDDGAVEKALELSPQFSYLIGSLFSYLTWLLKLSWVLLKPV